MPSNGRNPATSHPSIFAESTPRDPAMGNTGAVLRRLLPVLLLLLTGCGGGAPAAAADPVELLDRWRDAMAHQGSVRFEVDTRAEGRDPWHTTWSGVLHLATSGFLGTTKDSDVTMRHESKYGRSGYHVVDFDDTRETYVEHTRLRLPVGKSFVRLDRDTQVPWVWDLTRQISMDSNDFHPSALFGDLDRDTLRLVAATGDRYVLAAGRAEESNPATSASSEVTLTVWTDDADRVTRAEQSSVGEDRQQHHTTTVFADWGAAPPVRRPPADTVAGMAEVTWSPR
ncbi:MAG TPA: hypothetical protein VFV67_26760 [Actinophytocola sp.]|uniref:hypothetical protein n=1 Tax=Actinophytocola sp. TaxID=1872138 RepID=UPI002DBE3F21|nr:hypothetical protein [Actinophytocola sp.]HEU5474265.1 hypothetical protein [Actinophytocola sp.]